MGTWCHSSGGTAIAASGLLRQLRDIAKLKICEAEMYILYHHPYSEHSRRVLALLEEAGLEHEVRQVALDKGEQCRRPIWLSTRITKFRR